MYVTKLRSMKTLKLSISKCKLAFITLCLVWSGIMLVPHRIVKKCIMPKVESKNTIKEEQRYPQLHKITKVTSNYRVSCESPNSRFEVYVHDPSIDEYLSKSILETGQWNAKAMNEVFRLLDKIILKASGTGANRVKVLDVGANIGYHAFLIASFSPLAHVVAIEPHQMHANLLEKSLKLNPTLKVDLIKVALSRPEDDGKYLV